MDENPTCAKRLLAKLQEQIETSRKMIEESKRWLATYLASVNRERQNPGGTRHFIASASPR